MAQQRPDVDKKVVFGPNEFIGEVNQRHLTSIIRLTRHRQMIKSGLKSPCLGQQKQILCSIDTTPIVRHLEQSRVGGGRDDRPVAAMLRALLARIWLQHDSIALFRCQLSRNPSLMAVMLASANQAVDRGKRLKMGVSKFSRSHFVYRKCTSRMMSLMATGCLADEAWF